MSELCTFCNNEAVKIVRDNSLGSETVKVCEEHSEFFKERDDTIQPEDNSLSKGVGYSYEIQEL